MKLLPWIGGFLIGAILGGGIVADRLGAFAPYSKDAPWSLPGFDYQELGKDGIYITGTLKGDHVGYPYNTWNIRCIRDEGTCEVANVSQIGGNQLGEITSFRWPIVSWTDTLVVLQDDNSPNDTSCARATITINREGGSVAYMSAPINSEKTYCKAFGTSGPQQWEIGQPRQPWESDKANK